jgi:hypothetical protein
MGKRRVAARDQLSFLFTFRHPSFCPLALQVHICISSWYMFAYTSVDALQRYRGPDVVLHYVSNFIANASGRSGGFISPPCSSLANTRWSQNPITACRPHSLRSGIHGLGLNAAKTIGLSSSEHLLTASRSRDLDHKDFTKASQTSLKTVCVAVRLLHHNHAP